MWYIYLLTNGSRTYIGSTTDPNRRLRQHNSEIRGGARSTRGHKWELVAYVGGFQSRSEACRWERICKCRARGLDARLQALAGLLRGECPRKRGRPPYPVPTPLSITVLPGYSQLVQ